MQTWVTLVRIRFACLGFLSWSSFVINYLGSSSISTANPEAASNPFFGLAPNNGMVLMMVIVATMATVIASQALITGVFSLSRQAVQLGFSLA
jgi:KUP system potassium uptake protein